MQKGKLYFTISCPRAGKTTFCHQWANPEKMVLPPRVVLSGDSFRKAIHGMEFNPHSEGHVFAAIDTAAKALLLSGYDVMIDETSTTEATIARYFKIDPNAEWVWIETPPAECIRRALADGKPYLVEPIKRMAAQLEQLKDAYPANFHRLREQALARQKQDVTI